MLEIARGRATAAPTARGGGATRGVNVEHSDLELIEEIRAGSTVAFDVLMTRYERLVYKVSFGYTADQEDSLDVTQDVFFKVYRKLDSFSAKGSFKAWLLRIAHNECIDWLRRHSKDRFREELTEATLPTDAIARRSDQAAVDQRRHIASALAHLSPKQRQAIIMRYFQSLSIREISSVLGCSEGTAKSLLFRSIRILRDRTVPQWSRS
jgi:RNA polymerase sigma-70 factor (ECF subfamily)